MDAGPGQIPIIFCIFIELQFQTVHLLDENLIKTQ
jgi:hypothetical protein